MPYYICLKPEDKNLLHIIEADDKQKSVYSSYIVMFSAENEIEAYETVADLLQDFCKYDQDFGFGGHLDTAKFKAWLLGVKS